MPISRSVGSTMKTSQSAMSMVAHTVQGSERRMSVPDNIREEQPAGHREHDVESCEDRDPVARRAEPAREHGARRLDGADEERDEERQEKQRQEDFTRARADGDRREERR